jgi:hypothetical protein
MPFTEVSSLLHGSGDTHSTSESSRAIADFRLFHTQRKALFTTFSNTKNCTFLLLFSALKMPSSNLGKD